MDQKPLLYFVPAYIGSLKYFTKLASYLEPYYRVEFLITHPSGLRRDQMEEYLKESKYKYYILEKGSKSSGFRIPFLTPVWKRISHIRACRKFLKKYKPDKLVLTKNIPPYDILLKEANRLSIDTVMLQWAFGGGDKKVSTFNLRAPSKWEKYYYDIVDYLNVAVDFLFGGSAYVKLIGTVDRVGIMNKSAIEVHKDRCGILPEQMTLVGAVDQQLIYELKEKVKSDASFKKNLEQKYTIAPEKKTIVVLAWHLYRRRRWDFSVEEHLEYFRALLESISKSFSSEDADIILKLHPGDDPSVYDSFKDLPVKIVGDEAETEELVCLADVCISDPRTAANILIIASGTPAMFVNFSRLTAVNTGKELYDLREITTTQEQFESLLQKFKKGQFQSQYDKRNIDTNAIDKAIALIRRK